jgi:pimeloyl-ACP methyl ester carboxylesterase
LLIHGATYNHDYWDFGKVDGINYSYARDVAARGIPTFAFDQLGSGSSSRPRSDQLTIQAAAYVAHQIVQELRSGCIAGVQFGKVITVGHSLGSVVAWAEAICYADVDGVIVTGAAHSITFQTLAAIDFYPPVYDPSFASSGLDIGYLTTVPGTRANLFYSPLDDDPGVFARDEARKDVASSTEFDTGLPIVTSTATVAIHVPVLTILGGNDLPICGANTQGRSFDCSSASVVAAQEAPFYSPQARIQACVVPASGHDVSLAVNHQLQVADSVAWSFAFVGQQRFNESQIFDGSDRGLPSNFTDAFVLRGLNALPWNCGGPE